MVDFMSYDNYPSYPLDNSPLSYGSGEDEGSSSEVDQTELEVALYSQIHFEHNPTLDLTDPHVSRVTLEEEVTEEPEEHELNWRERLLGGLNKVSRDKSEITVKSSENGTAKKDETSIMNQVDEVRKKKLKKKKEVEKNEVREKKLKKKKEIEKNEVVEEKSSKKKTRKKKEKSDSEAISKLLYRDEPENKLTALEMKSSKNKASTPKNKPPRVVVVSQDSDDSDFDEGAARKEKRINLNDFIVIDSVSGSESDTLGAENNPITIDSDMNISRIKRYSETEKEVEEVDLCSSSDDDVSSDDDDDDIPFNTTINESTDIQINYSGFKTPLSRPAKNVSLEDVNLEDIEDLTVEDIHKSLGECDWSLVSQDRHSGAKSLTNRYFKELNVKCHNCKERGHLSKICPMPKKVPTCLMCGLEGHLFRSCPNTVCFNCLHVGHRREACERPRRRAFSTCNRCGMQGHDSKECTDLWRQYHMTTETGPLNKVRVTENDRVFCYNCAEEGHFGHDCDIEFMDRYKTPQWPFIAYYQLQGPSPNNQETPSTSGTAGMTKIQRRKEKKIRKQMERKMERKMEKEANPRPEKPKKQKKIKQSPFIKNAQKRIESNEGQSTRYTKKRKTQNERFEEEYQGIIKRSKKNDQQQQRQQQKRQQQQQKRQQQQQQQQSQRPQKKKNTRYSLEAQHGGDFQRSKRPQQRPDHSQGSEYQDRPYQPKGKKRKMGNETQWDHNPGGKRARYNSNMDQQGPGFSRKQKQKKQFTSERGFRSYR